MSDEQKKATITLDWGKMCQISEMAAEREIEERREMSVMVGLLAWGGVRKIAEDRLKSPCIYDELIIDTISWRPSFLVAADNIMVVPTDDTRKEIPLVELAGMDLPGSN